MTRKLGFTAFMLLLPTLASAGLIYATTPNTSPPRGTISPSGYVSAPNTGTTTFTVSANSGYMVNSVTLNNVAFYPNSSGQYVVTNKPATQQLKVSFLPATPPKLTASVAGPLFAFPGIPITVSGTASTITLPWGTLATYLWSTDPSSSLLSPTSGTVNASTNLKTTFTSNITGVYALTLKLTASGVADSSATTNVIVMTDNVVASKTCLECHQSNSVVLPYVNSTHAKVPGAPTCYTCHNPTTPPMPHPGYPLSTVKQVCVTCHNSSFNPPFPQPRVAFHQDFLATPDICITCHNQHSLQIIPAGLPKPHFNSVTSISNPNYTAMYVTSRTKCNYCHGTPLWFQDPPTLPAAQARTQWAASGKGDVTSIPWKGDPTHNWKATGTQGADAATTTSQDCVRCHTSTGFVQYSKSGYHNISPVGVASDKTSEPLTCNACHNSDQEVDPFSVRSVDNVTAYYNYSSAATKKLIVKFDQFFGYKPFFNPPVPVTNGGSNLCISCHAGRQSGATIKAAAAAGLNFSNASFMNSHYMTAAGSLYQSTGFYFYTSTRYLPGNAAKSHQQAGTDPVYGLPGGSNGPCAACHMNSSPPKHSYKPLTRDADGKITNFEATVCYQCHQYDVTFIQQQEDGFLGSLDALQYVLKQKGIYYSATYPYFFKSEGPYTTANAFKDWNSVYPDKGANVMGATFNFNLMKRELGAWAHNPVNTKRLLWDSIDFIDDGIMNNSTSMTIVQLPVTMPHYYDTIFYLDGSRP